MEAKDEEKGGDSAARPSEEKGGDSEPSLAAKLSRFVEKNPLYKSAIKRFMEEHCAQFAGDEGDEHKLEWTQLHHEFVQVTAPPTPTQSTSPRALPRLASVCARPLCRPRASHTRFHDTAARQIVENALALFMRKTKGASEEELMAQLTSEGDEHKDLVEALAAKADYQTFIASMRSWRRQALQKQFDGMVGASERGVSSSHK